MDKNASIFLIIPTLKMGGAERVISVLANQFCSYDTAQIHLILLAKSKDFYTIDERVIIHKLGFENKGILQKKFSEIKTFFLLRKLFRRYKPLTTLSFMEKYNVFSIIASFGLGMPIYISDRSNPLKPISIFDLCLKRFTYKFAAGIIAQTSHAKLTLSKYINNKNIKIIPNPLRDVEQFPQLKREKIILNIGRLVPEKGQKYLLDIFFRLGLKDWILVILGEGPLDHDLRNQAKQLGITDQVIMPGAVLNVDEWLARSSIFAFTSISEGFPNALAEAMASGLASVSFDCDSGPSELINNNYNGLLVPLLDINEMRESILSLINSEDKRMYLGLNAKKLLDELSEEKIGKFYWDFIFSWK